MSENFSFQFSVFSWQSGAVADGSYQAVDHGGEFFGFEAPNERCFRRDEPYSRSYDGLGANFTRGGSRVVEKFALVSWCRAFHAFGDV